MPSAENAGLDQSFLLNPRPPHLPTKAVSNPSSDSEEAMDVGDDGRPAPCTPKAPSAQTIDLSTPRPLQSRDTGAPPSGPCPAPTGKGLPLKTPTNHSGPSRR